MKQCLGYAITRHVAASDGWVDIYVPMFCNYFGMRNLGAEDGNAGHASSVLVRSDPNRPETEDVIATGNQIGVTSAFQSIGWGSARFQREDRLFSVKSAGEFPQIVVMTWVQ